MSANSNNKYHRSPIRYSGSKYTLLPQIIPLFPDKSEVDYFFDLFGGSGTVSLNVDYPKICYNEINQHVFDLLWMFLYKSPQTIDEHIKQRIKDFNLPKYKGQMSVEEEKANYLKFRNFYNTSRESTTDLDLLTLTYFSFSQQMRFNNEDMFNLPRGNNYYTKDRYEEFEHAYNVVRKPNFVLSSLDAFVILTSFLNKHSTRIFFEDASKNISRCFFYVDPPYTNTTAVYNEKGGWTIQDDLMLFKALDAINDRGGKFALSNVASAKGKTNQHLLDWAESKGYKIIPLDKQYSAMGKGNANAKEVLIINYEPHNNVTLF